MIELDKQDLAILRLLQEDAARSTAEIAEKLHMSQSPCWRRINKMEEAGVIAKRVAIVDRAKVGISLVAFTTINLPAAGRKNMEAFEEAVQKFDEVVECYTMTGAWDYMLKIVVRDIEAFEQFVRNHLLELPMIGEIHSHLAVTEIKNDTALPIDQLS
ncbi:MAG: Lrp/AsnC family transcriptional regulator [Alphaproteobacteria bacterium]